MTTSLLATEDLHFGYRHSPDLYHGLEVSFAPGEVVAITGPSGCGKSTLLYLLGLMLAPRGGRVLVDGAAIPRGDRPRAALRARRFGFVFQDAALDPTRTILDNITETCLYRGEPRGRARDRARELMERFGVGLRADHKPGQISGGQAQRVALCRALLHRPAIVLADEPTGNLDDASAEIVWDALAGVAADGGTVATATHDPRLIERCSRRIALTGPTP